VWGGKKRTTERAGIKDPFPPKVSKGGGKLIQKNAVGILRSRKRGIPREELINIRGQNRRRGDGKNELGDLPCKGTEGMAQSVLN